LTQGAWDEQRPQDHPTRNAVERRFVHGVLPVYLSPPTAIVPEILLYFTRLLKSAATRSGRWGISPAAKRAQHFQCLSLGRRCGGA
jgi:hypothetical protein